jgi:site-specific DNA-methyltransferase (adenine-specific)
MINSNIYCGDAVAVLKGIPDNTVDLTVTNPPEDIVGYFKDRLSTFIHNELELNKIETLQFDTDKIGHYIDMRGLIKELYRVTKVGGVVVWILGDTTEISDISLRPFRHVFQFRDAGFDLHETIIYLHKQKKQTSKKHAPIFDYMFVFYKGFLKTFNQLEERKGNVWEPIREDKFPVEWQDGAFKEEVPEDLILTYTNEGDTVLDPFCGSGTTLKCAKLHNRNYIGIDVINENCILSEKRVNE